MQVGASSPRRRPQLIDLNFVPVELRPRRFPFLTAGLALLLVGGVLLLFCLAYLGGKADLEVARLKDQVAQARVVVNAARGDEASANLERQRVIEMQSDYRLLTDRQVAWSRVLTALADAPVGVRVESIDQSGFVVTARGSAPSYAAATEFLSRLRASELFQDIALEVTGEMPAAIPGSATAPGVPPLQATNTPLGPGLVAGTPVQQATTAPTRPVGNLAALATLPPSATPGATLTTIATVGPAATRTPASTATSGPTRTPIPTPAVDYAVTSKVQIPRVAGGSDVTYVRGRVEDEAGNIVSGARVRIASGGDWSAENPADRRNGTFEFAVTRGTFSVQVLDARSELATGLYTGSTNSSEAYDWNVVFRHTTMPVEATTDENGTPLPTRTPTMTPTASPTSISPGKNIASEANQRSASANEADLSLAVDGNASTIWNSMLYPSSSPGDPPYIRFDYDQPRLIEGIELIVAQTPSGNTVHELWLANADGVWDSSPIATFQQSTSDGQVIAYRLSPAREVKGVYIRTTRSPSFVAWREVKIYTPIVPPGGFSTSTPTMTPTTSAGVPTATPTVTPTTLPLWDRVSPPSANAQAGTPQLGHEAAKAIDGNSDTSWLPANSSAATEYLTVDLASAGYSAAIDLLMNIELVTAQGTGASYYDVYGRREPVATVITGATTPIPTPIPEVVLLCQRSAGGNATTLGCGFATPVAGVRWLQIAVRPGDGTTGIAELRVWKQQRPPLPGAGPGAAPSPSPATPVMCPTALATPTIRSASPPRSPAVPSAPSATGGRVEFTLLLEMKPGAGYR